MLIQTRRYVRPEEILTIDTTEFGDFGSCQLWVQSPVCGHGFSVIAGLGEVAPLLFPESGRRLGGS